MNWPECQVQKAGIATSFFVLIVASVAGNSINVICSMLAGIASKYISRH
ncbi:hypothetical protein JNO64_09995 [Streptococcus suis]|nr:hypothetical protein [Streptococcus suis]MBM0242490.1 hypothetical protein [Streptococcus suis]MBY4978203.1 hypothetical protein [Streptococcus suis]